MTSSFVSARMWRRIIIRTKKVEVATGVLVETTERRNVAGPRTVPRRGSGGGEGICTKEGCDWPKQRGEVLGCREASWFRATSFPTRVRVRRAPRTISQNKSFDFLLSAKGKQYVLPYFRIFTWICVLTHL